MILFGFCCYFLKNPQYLSITRTQLFQRLISKSKRSNTESLRTPFLSALSNSLTLTQKTEMEGRQRRRRTELKRGNECDGAGSESEAETEMEWSESERETETHCECGRE